MMPRPIEEPIYGERFCPNCGRTWLTEVRRVERIESVRPRTCPDCLNRAQISEGMRHSFERLMANLIAQPAELQDGLCRQVDPDLFYPERGGSTKQARAVCARCPVLAACRSWAVETRQAHGIWGGTTERERAAMLAEREGGAA